MNELVMEIKSTLNFGWIRQAACTGERSLFNGTTEGDEFYGKFFAESECVSRLSVSAKKKMNDLFLLIFTVCYALVRFYCNVTGYKYRYCN